MSYITLQMRVKPIFVIPEKIIVRSQNSISMKGLERLGKLAMSHFEIHKFITIKNRFKIFQSWEEVLKNPEIHLIQSVGFYFCLIFMCSFVLVQIIKCGRLVRTSNYREIAIATVIILIFSASQVRRVPATKCNIVRDPLRMVGGRRGPHLTLQKQQVGWGTRLGRGWSVLSSEL